jgi:hypothetical protein
MQRRKVMEVRGGLSGGGKERGRREDGVEVKELGVSIITIPPVSC